MPATSPPVRSSTSTAKPFLSQYLMYMRSSIAAQSCASVPPEPAWMSTKQLLGSSGLENMRRNSSAATSLSRSEEHTSELQSLAYLVCRLLLEKKKKNLAIRWKEHPAQLTSPPNLLLSLIL